MAAQPTLILSRVKKYHPTTKDNAAGLPTGGIILSGIGIHKPCVL
jgi:hypothetical protein